MRPSARIDRDCWILSQIFEGYGGYVYEVLNRWSKVAYFEFAFIGEEWPKDDEAFEIVFSLNDGIKWIKEKVTGKQI